MRIISKFKDYYDIGLSMGIDESITYVRNTHSVESKSFTSASMMKLMGYTSKRNKYMHTLNYGLGAKYCFVVGFCGKLYSAMMIPNGKSNCKTPFDGFNFFYSWDDSIHDLFQKNERYYSREQYDTQFKKFLSLEPVVDDSFFHHYKTPLFIIPNNQLVGMYGHENYGSYNIMKQFILDPNLSDIGFQKVVDPYTAYQDVMMYITGVLSENQIPPVTISDTDMRDAKGFDDRSFKKEPTKKYRK